MVDLTRFLTTDLMGIHLTDGGDGFKRSWIMLLPEGKFEHPRFGELDLTHKTLTEMVQNFKANARGIEIALDYDHKASDGDSRAPGWLEDMQVRPAKGETPAGLWGLVRWTPLGLKDIQDQIYRYVSAEFKEDYKDDVSGEKYKNVIIGATLTNRPFMKQMPAVKLSETVSRKPWSSVDKSSLPDSAFLDPKNRRLPVREADGTLNINGVKAALGAVHGARSGKPMTGLPNGIVAKLEAWLKQYGEDSSDSETKAASEAAEEEPDMATRTSRKLADDVEDAPAEDEEQELEAPEEDELPEDDDEGEDESEDSSESSDGDGEEEEEEEDEPQEASTLSEMMEHITGRKTLAAPTAKKGRKALPKPSADDEEDAADGGDDEDTELDDAEEYDEVSVSPVHIPGEMKIARGKAKAAAKTAPKKMSESVILAEQVAQLTAQLSEAQSEIKTLREREFTHSVGVHLAEMTRHIRLSDGVDDQFALSRPFRRIYETFMFDEGVKLSESTLDKINGLVLHALRHSVVPLTSMASHVEQPAGVVSLDDRRPRVTSKDPGEASKQRLAEAKAIALSEGKNFDELEYDDKIAFIGRVRGRDGHGEPVA